MKLQPTILLVALDNWLGIARMPKALKQAGFAVHTISPDGSYLSKTRFVDTHVTLPRSFNGNVALSAIRSAVEKHRPDVLLLGDEIALQMMYRVMQSPQDVHAQLGLSAEFVALVHGALGGVKHMATLRSKQLVNDLARSLDITVPEYELLRDAQRGFDFASRVGYPIIVKPDFGFAGIGVGIIGSEAEFRQTLPLIVQYQRANNGLPFYVQRYVEGRVAMYPFVAHRGTILEGFGAFKERCHPEITGATSVLRAVAHDGMKDTVKRLIGATALTGFGSADFIIGPDDTAHFLELNLRAIPASHLGDLLGANLCAALFDKVSGSKRRTRKQTLQHELIALFPQEFQRDPASDYLATAFVDRPVDDPELLEAYGALIRPAQPVG